MSIRKRTWKKRDGTPKEAWVVDYVDGQGKRRLKTFARKEEADAFNTVARVELTEGTHVADRASVTVKEAGALWLARARAEGLERVTVESYQQQLSRHIVPFLGSSKISQL